MKLTQKQKETLAYWFIMLSQTAILLTILFISLKHSNDDREREEKRRENQTTKIYDDYGK